MRLVLFEAGGLGVRPGVWTDAGVVDVSSAVLSLHAESPQQLMRQIIDGFPSFKPAFEQLVGSKESRPGPTPTDSSFGNTSPASLP